MAKESAPEDVERERVNFRIMETSDHSFICFNETSGQYVFTGTGPHNLLFSIAMLLSRAGLDFSDSFMELMRVLGDKEYRERK